MSHPTLEELMAKGSPAFRRLNQGAVASPASILGVMAELAVSNARNAIKSQGMTVPGAPEAKTKRIHQSAKHPNNLEAAWAEWFRGQNGEIVDLRYEAIRLEIGTGAWYTPDWSYLMDSTLCFVEVKGPFANPASFVRIKSAARQYRNFNFSLWWKDQGCWRMQEILP